MPKVLNRTMGPQQAAPVAPPQEVDPYETMLLAQIERMNAMKAQPMYSPEEAAARREQNEREYQLGILGMMSGSEMLGGAGGHVLKHALAQRQPRVTERGVADPITGEFRYDPDYLRQMEEGKLDKIMVLKAAADARKQESLRSEQLRRDLADNANRTRIEIHAGGNEFGAGMVPIPGVVDPGSGLPLFKDKMGRVGKLDPVNGTIIPYTTTPNPMAPAPAAAPGGVPATPGTPGATPSAAKPPAAPGGPSGMAPKVTGTTNKMPAEMARMMVGMQSADEVISRYEQALKDFDPRRDQFDMTKRAAFGSIYKQFISEIKETMALGALTGPDLGLSKGVLEDPTGPMGVVYGREGLTAQLAEARKFIKGRREGINKMYPPTVTPGAPPTANDPNDPLGYRSR